MMMIMIILTILYHQRRHLVAVDVATDDGMKISDSDADQVAGHDWRSVPFRLSDYVFERGSGTDWSHREREGSEVAERAGAEPIFWRIADSG